MLKKIAQIQTEAQIFKITNTEELEQFRLHFLSKKGIMNQLFTDFKNINPESKKEVGLSMNNLKELLQKIYDENKETLSNSQEPIIRLDLTRPSSPIKWGSRHPINLVRKEINDIFSRIGYVIADGPEIEDDWHVFSALNFPEEHPARDMQDTFFINTHPDILLRTHTSSVQVRTMETQPLPIRVICPGRVFRNEAISARSHCLFHQIEGLAVDKNISFADMKQSILFFAQEMFGKTTKIRLRPSFFPFTEPSAEMDVNCTICGGKGCNVCKDTGWLEIMGCGMVDPNVLDYCGINSNEYSGFAFGMGIERIAMLKYQIKDIRLFFENDLRFLKQFQHQI